MLRITKQADYGIQLMSQMAVEPERLFNAPELSGQTQLPLPTVSKILKLLAKNGLLRSQRGVRGGYTLARSPETISLEEIVSALEGPLALTECATEDGGRCGKEDHCAQRSHWQAINHKLQETLKQTSLIEMTRPVESDHVGVGGEG